MSRHSVQNKFSGAVQVAVRKGAVLTVQALGKALFNYPPPKIFHSYNGKGYDARAFVEIFEEWEINVVRSRPGCPWENGYQESFYDKFKIDLGDPGRTQCLKHAAGCVCREGSGITKSGDFRHVLTV